MKSKILIVGGGLLGNELNRVLKNMGKKPSIVKNVTIKQKQIIPKECDTIIIVAQSHDYKKSIMTKNLFYVNTILPIQIILQAKEMGVKNIVYYSTGSVYNRSSKAHKENEIINPYNVSPYVATKQASENLISSWKNNFTQLIIMRPFFMYGYGQSADFLIPRMIDNIQNQREIKLANNKGLIFNPIYVNDAARFIITALKQGKRFVIYNVAGAEKISLKELVKEISNLLGKN